MIQFTEPVKFLKSEKRTGTSKTGNPYEMVEATFFVTDLGRIKIPVVGNPSLPAPGSFVNVALAVEQGSFQSMRVVFDESCKFALVK